MGTGSSQVSKAAVRILVEADDHDPSTTAEATAKQDDIDGRLEEANDQHANAASSWTRGSGSGGGADSKRDAGRTESKGKDINNVHQKRAIKGTEGQDTNRNAIEAFSVSGGGSNEKSSEASTAVIEMFTMHSDGSQYATFLSETDGHRYVFIQSTDQSRGHFSLCDLRPGHPASQSFLGD